LECGVVSAEAKRRADFNLGFVSELGADKLRRLQCPLEGAGDDDINLDLEGAEDSRHQHALVLSLFDEGPLSVKDWISAGDSGIGVAHQIEIHCDLSGGWMGGPLAP